MFPITKPIFQINHMFEDPAFRDEPLTGWTEDPNNYGYTHHIYTKDLVRIKSSFNKLSLKL